MVKNRRVEENFFVRNFSFLSMCCLIVLVIAVIGVTYSIFIWTGNGNTSNSISRGTVAFSHVESPGGVGNGIKIENAMPISDEVGKKLQLNDYGEGSQGYFDFIISCSITGSTFVNYEVYANKSFYPNMIPEDTVKIYLTDSNNEVAYPGYEGEVPTYSSLDKALSDSSARRIYHGTFTKTGMSYFRLRMWISKDYEIKSLSDKFSIKVNVSATNQ